MAKKSLKKGDEVIIDLDGSQWVVKLLREPSGVGPMQICRVLCPGCNHEGKSSGEQ